MFNIKDLNELPIYYFLMWMEQKAVAILWSLLYLGVKGIRIGPIIPPWINEEILTYLTTKFDLKLIDEPEKDLKEILK